MPLSIRPEDLPRARRSDASARTPVQLTGPIDVIDAFSGGGSSAGSNFQSDAAATSRAAGALQLPLSYSSAQGQVSGGSGGGGVLSDIEIANAARSAGFKGQDLITAVSVALAESDGNPATVYNNSDNAKSSDLGLFQINDYWNREWLDGSFGDPFNPYDSARMAYDIWSKRGWRDWVTFTKGRNNKYMSRAIAAARAVG